MKHLLTILLSLIMLPASVLAQGALSHLGVGLEAGTTGWGVNLSVPLFSNHLYLTAGVNFPNLSVKQDIGFSADEANEKLHEMNQKIDRFNQTFLNAGLSHVDYLNDKITVDASMKLNMQTYKVLLELYPSSHRVFHFTAGVFIGKDEFLDTWGRIDARSWNTYQQAIATNNRIREIEKSMGVSGYHVDGLEEVLSYNVNSQTFRIDSRSDGSIDAAIELMTVRPYLGIGFGRSVPQRHRVGFQFEMGVWYHGKPKLTSSNEVPYDPSVHSDVDLDKDITDVVDKLQIYPQITFRLTGRIF